MNDHRPTEMGGGVKVTVLAYLEEYATSAFASTDEGNHRKHHRGSRSR